MYQPKGPKDVKVYLPKGPEVVKDDRLIEKTETRLKGLLGRLVDEHGEVHVGTNQRFWRWILLSLLLLQTTNKNSINIIHLFIEI